MELFKGRPNDQRIAKEVKVYDFLDGLGIEYERIDHDAADTMELCLEIDKALGTKICKNLFLCNRQKTDFYLLMMPGEKPFKTKDLSAQIQSSRLSFADAEAMEKYLDITPGSVSVTGLINDVDCHVTLLVDKDLLDSEFIGLHPNINTSSLKIRTKDIFEKVVPATKHSYQIVELPISC